MKLYAKGKRTKVKRKASHRRAKKKKINYRQIIGLIIIVLAITCISQNFKNQKSEEIVETTAQITEENIIQENITKESNIEEIESIPEDAQIKGLIEKTIAKKHLTNENFAFFYYNVNQNTSYFYNENTYFTGASTVKVPVAMLYYDKINNGEITLDSTLEYTEDCYEEGSGLTNYKYEASDKIPIKFLIEQSIVNSDNTALNILVKNVGKKQYRYEIAEYSDLKLSDEFYEGNVTCAKYGYDLLKYIYKNSNSYSGLIEYMQKSSNDKYLKKYIKTYKIAHKYGSYEGNVHDYGIVYGDTTYLIGVYTKGIANADELIADISLEVSNTVNKQKNYYQVTKIRKNSQ